MKALAPAKINLSLFLGPHRGDGRHELVTVFESLSLADELELCVIDDGIDEVECEGVDGPNLVSEALVGLRQRGWEAPPVRIRIEKLLPVAAGLGGGSADAAAALRLAERLAPLPPGAAEAVARELGADVPAQLVPGLWLGTGAGEFLEPLGELAPHAFVIVPQPFPLSTAEVYREADRLALPRAHAELVAVRDQLLSAVRGGGPLPAALVVNDLEPATLSLAPTVAEALAELRKSGADEVLVCGSGPTTAGLFWGGDALGRAERALAVLPPAASVAAPYA